MELTLGSFVNDVWSAPFALWIIVGLAVLLFLAVSIIFMQQREIDNLRVGGSTNRDLSTVPASQLSLANVSVPYEEDPRDHVVVGYLNNPNRLKDPGAHMERIRELHKELPRI